MVYDCIIIGSGVAGLTAGIYLGRVNKNVLIIENGSIGGTTAELELIENYPGFEAISGKDLVSNMVMQVVKNGININICDINKIDYDKKCIYTMETIFEYKTLIIASGMSVKTMNLLNEDKYKFKGLSYCAVCDGALYKHKKIVVVSDGLSGKSSVNYLKNISRDITVLDISNTFKDDSINVISNVIPIEIIGDKFVSGFKYKVDNKEYVVDCNAIFVSLGKYVNTKLYEDKIQLNNNHIVTDESMKTNLDGVYAVGDNRDKNLRQIVTACSDGAIAGNEVLKILSTY